MLGFIRGGLEDFSISRAGAGWGIPFPVLPDGSDARRPDGTWDPDAGTIYVWYDALINYITGAGFPDDPELFARWWPADLHVIGKDIARFHTIFWPAMLWSAGLEAPRRVWVHGWLLAQGERMSKSRGNFLDPLDFVAAFGADGARYVALREAAFDRDSDVSWDGFLRRYNADLANDFGNLVNRTVSMAGRYLGGERPAPRSAADAAARGTLGGDARPRRGEARRLPGPRGARRPVGVRRGREPPCRHRGAVEPREGREGRRRGRRRRGCATSSATSSKPAGWSPSPPRRSCPGQPRASSPSWATPTHGTSAATAVRGSSPSWRGVLTPRSRGRSPRRRRSSRASRSRWPRPERASACARQARDAAPPVRHNGAMRLIDSHAHLQSPQFSDDLPEVLAAAELAGVERILVPGWDEDSSRRAIELVARFPRLVAAAGIHPHAAAETDDAAWERTVALAADPTVVGDRGDRARLRPPLLADRGPARQPAAEPHPRARDGQAGDPPLPERRRLARGA